jgi:lysozyme
MSENPNVDLEKEKLNLEKEKLNLEKERLQLERETLNKQYLSQRNVAIISLISIAFGGVASGIIQGIMNIKLEDKKRESQLFIQAIQTGDPQKSLDNLCALLNFGLIGDPENKLQSQCKPIKQRPPSLPSIRSSLDMVSQFEGTLFKVTKGPLGEQIIGSSHVLTPEERQTGKILIDGNPVDFRNGITEEQARKLLNQDLDPYRKAIDKLVKVKLTQNQRDALTSFAFNMGTGTLASSQLLKVLNEGKYEEVPNELRKYARAGGQELPGLKQRREAEIELWNTR